MNMEQFSEELERRAGPYGKKAWSIVETWYTSGGRARRLSLHDLHELSKAIADALKDGAAPELYEALKGLVDDDDWTVSLADQRSRHPQRIAIARAALAKAEDKHE